MAVNCAAGEPGAGADVTLPTRILGSPERFWSWSDPIPLGHFQYLDARGVWRRSTNSLLVTQTRFRLPRCTEDDDGVRSGLATACG